MLSAEQIAALLGLAVTALALYVARLRWQLKQASQRLATIEEYVWPQTANCPDGCGKQQPVEWHQCGCAWTEDCEGDATWPIAVCVLHDYNNA